MSLKVGYWATNEYHRLNVKDFVEEFCGWNPLLDLMNHADSQRNKAFLTALFQTGGRTSEVLALQKQNLNRYSTPKPQHQNKTPKDSTESLFSLFANVL